MIEYQELHAEFSAAAAEHSSSSSAASSPAAESKQQQLSPEQQRTKEVEFKVVLGKVSSERDQLREEVARLQRITSTLAPSVAIAAGKKRPATAGAAAAAVAVVGKTGGEKERQQAQTNVLVIELNDEVREIIQLGESNKKI